MSFFFFYKKIDVRNFIVLQRLQSWKTLYREELSKCKNDCNKKSNNDQHEKLSGKFNSSKVMMAENSVSNLKSLTNNHFFIEKKNFVA